MSSRILQQDSDALLTQNNEFIINENFIAANSIVTGSPVVGSTGITQDHNIAPTNISTGASVVSTAGITQDHNIDPTSISTEASVVSTTGITQDHNIAPSGITSGQPVVPTSAITQVHDLAASGIASGQPVVATSGITQDHNLSTVGVISGQVVISTAGLIQNHSLQANDLVTGNPIVPSVDATELENFLAVDLISGVPEVDTAAISQSNSFGADDILTGRPDVEDAPDPNVIYEQVVQQMFGGWPRRLYDHTDLAIARGHTTGYRALYKFGYNPDVNATEETVWAQGGNYPWLDNAVTMFVSSSSANDASGGTGANTILIQGLDEDYNEIEETVALNGQTQVVTQLSYLRVYRAFVTLAGSDGTSGGTIYIGSSGATAGVPNTVYANLGFGNQTQIAAYTVPAGYTLYLDDINFTAALSQANKTATCSFVSRDQGSNVFRTRFINVLQSNQLITKFEYPQPFAEKTDLECRVVTDTTNNAIGASFQGVLIKNDS